MKKVLVTGANGQLGLTLRDLADKYEDDFEFTFVSREELDITMFGEVFNLIGGSKYDYCINCAAYTNVELAEDKKTLAFDVNSYGARNLAFFCNRNNVTLIHISTDYVFGGDSDVPYKENGFIEPLNTYGETKLLGENYIKMSMQDYYIIRTSWLYSPYNKNFFNTVISCLDERGSMRVATEQTGSPTSTYTLGEALIHLMLNDGGEYGTYHLSNKGETTWYGFAREIAKLHGKGDILTIESYPTVAKRPKYSVLDCEKFELAFNYKIPNWEEALKEIYERKE